MEFGKRRRRSDELVAAVVEVATARQKGRDGHAQRRRREALVG